MKTKTSEARGSGFFDLSNLKGDLFGGITAGIVALPLALAFGEASGAGPIAGLWGAIFVGFFAAMFGGTGSQVSGPTGPMVVVFAGLYASLGGNPTLVFTAVVLAGLFQIAFGVMRFGQYVRLVPYPVISGFMSGIGCIIIALQMSRLFGHEPDGSGTIPALSAIPGAILDPNWAAVLVGGITLAIVFTWPRTLSRYIPGPLAALVIGTLVSLAVAGAPVLGNIPTGLPSFVMPSFSVDTTLVVLEAALVLALLGAIDSLLTSLVADNMTQTRHDSNRELVGQGIGNTVAGLFGAIPGAGATMRTVINIRTGGSTRISGMVHALLLLAVVVSLSPLAAQIPHAVLAGILVKVGYDIIDFSYLRRAHRGPRWDLVLMVLVLGLTVFVDLITAVAMGVVLAAMAFVKKLADDQLAKVKEGEPRQASDAERDLLAQARGRITMFDFDGPLSFGAAADLSHHVRERTELGTEAIILDFSRVPFMEVSAARAVETIVNDASARGKLIYLSGLNDEVRSVVTAMCDRLHATAETRIADRFDALKDAWERIGPDGPAPGALPAPA